MNRVPLALDDYLFLTCGLSMPKIDDIFSSKHDLTKCGICGVSIEPDCTISFGITREAEIKVSCSSCTRKLEYLLHRTQYKPKLYPYSVASGREILNQYYVPPYERNTLWRYMDFSKFTNILETSSLYLPKPCEYEDKLEGEFLLPHEKPEQYEEKFGEGFYNRLQTIKQQSRVLSFYYGEAQSMGLWNNYCQDRSTGIAMTFKYSSLSSTLSVLSEFGYALGLVKYLDYDKYHPNECFPLFVKRDIYDYEREARIVIYSEEKEINEKKSTIGISSEHVSAIYISPYAKPWFIKLVHRIVKKSDFRNVKIVDPLLSLDSA